MRTRLGYCHFHMIKQLAIWDVSKKAVQPDRSAYFSHNPFLFVLQMVENTQKLKGQKETLNPTGRLLCFIDDTMFITFVYCSILDFTILVTLCVIVKLGSAWFTLIL